ncbi:ribosome-associated translation inhibitor RaiA [Chelatococcus sp. SYSU_G07232]|uniref:Ribosome hibernation promoting factor n=1 Tax=Chelatococcus albus TaxID=3047466 RepID=A0ABT7AI79_9HYPH|nr:ribosome-associated translation inhibitor RaiA [Chelatococcus sp. SYSU_G07232]MDJ1158785.1 ribosome-associated translation inhibitor RaiA [Chelatococcus sp. SYSU_G07232]
MTLRVSGKNLDIGEALRGQVEERVASAIAKYFEGGYSGHVTVAREGTGFRTDCVLHLASGITLEASGMAHDAHVSFDQTADRIEKRLRRYKRRLRDRSAANGAATATRLLAAQGMPAYVLEAPGEEEEFDEGYHPAVVAETTKPLHVLSVSDAVVELDLTGKPVVVFRHAGSGRVNVVYRRLDGTIGWVDPPAAAPTDQA